MTAAILVDVFLGVIFLASLRSGWRHGAFSAGFAALGIAAGLIVGIVVSAFVVDLADVTSIRVLLLLATVVLFVALGNIVGTTVGSGLRERMRSKTTQRWDSAVGALLQLVIAVVMVWLVAIPVAANAGGSLGKGVRESRVLTAIDSVAPSWANKVPEHIAALIDVTGLPPLVSPFQGAGADVEAVNPEAVAPAVIDAARAGVVHVLGDSTSCSRHMSGSGFVAAPDYVITNAHVVAGTDEVELDTVVGVKQATVVFFDPEVDLAVLHIPNLGIEPVRIAQDPAHTGDDVVVLGYPGTNPFTASPARVRDRIMVSGPDIYATGRTEREAYTLRGDVRPGNSGGPVIAPDGAVVGVIFGTAVDGSETGFALTMDQVQRVVGEYVGLTAAVDTQACVA
ncbi:MarP family serine protease [Corynebacterium sp. CCUG 65737]|uniref:MarP family serine protease n=1 Tax=Corynebacterium sp. CCUG 65737 TaxID=2823889 RepID=UPI00210E542F|nr:MarP family serine protease [Corynebacterium sp. CCUG 65737]